MCGFSGSEKEARVLASSSSFSSTPAGGGGLNGPRSRRAGAEAAVAETATAVRAAEWAGGGAMERQRWLPLEANPEVRAAQISAWGRGQGQREPGCRSWSRAGCF